MGELSTSCCIEPPKALFKKVYALLCLNQDVPESGKRREVGNGKRRQSWAGMGWEADLLLTQNNEWVSQSQPTCDLTTSWLLLPHSGCSTRQAVRHLAFFANTAHQPIILTFPQCYYCIITKEKVGRQAISKVISLRLTALNCAFTGKEK